MQLYYSGQKIYNQHTINNQKINIFYQKMSYVFKPVWVPEGKGVKVLRIIGGQNLRNFDPFLLFDYAKARLPVGFPDHPHRGFQTVGYILSGSMYHQDCTGRKGKRGAGDLVWMTAGRGIVHSQLPASQEEDSVGFQLWVNLKSKDKMIPPAYQQFDSDKIQIFKKGKIEVKILCGEWEGKTGPVTARTPSYYFDVRISPGGEFDLPIPGDWNTIVFVYEGSVTYQNKSFIDHQHCCVLEKSSKQQIVHKFKSQKGGKFVLVGGKPLSQPISRYGPFVMNTQEQLEQAFTDYHQGKNGFENAKNWQSKIKHLMKGKKIEELWV